LENYIVRIYRYDRDNPRNFVGVVEDVNEKEKRAFNTYDDLWEILRSPRRGKEKIKKRGKRG
jgi:hypothetical protein